MRSLLWSIFGLVAIAPAATLVACLGDDPVLASGGQPDAAADGAAPAPPTASGGDAGADANADAADPDPPSAQRMCVLACEAAAGDSALTFYNTVQACTCDADGGACADVCPSYCQSPSADSNACNDCVAKGYVGPCSIAVDCGGDEACVTFADCVRACVDAR
jgi:hypothetical protein